MNKGGYNGYRLYGAGPVGMYRERTVPVMSFPANAFGLHDMHGNVNEWVEDCSHRTYEDAPWDGSAWISSRETGGTCSLRVVRGGSWRDWPQALRSANRVPLGAGTRSDVTGFRIARTLAP